MAGASESAVPPPRQLSGNNNDLSTTGSLHAVFGFSISFFGSLVSLKYLGSTENPFEDQAPVMMLLLYFSFLYVMAVLSEIRNGVDHGAVNTTKFFRVVYIISGSIVQMVLGYILSGPYVLILMNPATFLLVEALLVLFKKTVPNVPDQENPKVAPEENPATMPSVIDERQPQTLKIWSQDKVESPAADKYCRQLESD